MSTERAAGEKKLRKIRIHRRIVNGTPYVHYMDMMNGLLDHAEAVGPEAEDFVYSFFQHLKVILVKNANDG